MAKKTRRPKPTGAYETRTPEKELIGAHMKTAREIAGYTQDRAAELLGYSSAVQLCQMETGKRPLPIHVVVKAAGLYGTTTDYLLGIDEDSDRDPARALMKRMEARISADMQHLIRELSEMSADFAKSLLPTATQGAQVARSAIELADAVARFRALNRDAFDDDMRGGAQLLAKADVAAARAQEYAQQVERAQRLLSARTQRAINEAEAGQVSLLPILDLTLTEA